MGVLAEREAKARLVDEGAVDKPHSSDETDCSEHTDGREVPDGIEAIVLQNGECCRVGQRDSRHIECHAQGVERNEQRFVGQFIAEACLFAHPPAADHEGASHQMAQSQQALWLDVLVGNDTHQRWHKDADNALNGIEP